MYSFWRRPDCASIILKMFFVGRRPSWPTATFVKVSSVKMSSCTITRTRLWIFGCATWANLQISMLTEKIMIFSPCFLLKTRPPFFNLQIEPYVLVVDLLMKALLRAPLQLLPSLHARVTTKKSGTEDLDIKDMIKQVVMGVVVGHKEGEKEVSKHFIDLLRMPL